MLLLSITHPRYGEGARGEITDSQFRVGKVTRVQVPRSWWDSVRPNILRRFLVGDAFPAFSGLLFCLATSVFFSVESADHHCVRIFNDVDEWIHPPVPQFYWSDWCPTLRISESWRA